MAMPVLRQTRQVSLHQGQTVRKSQLTSAISHHTQTHTHNLTHTQTHTSSSGSCRSRPVPDQTKARPRPNLGRVRSSLELSGVGGVISGLVLRQEHLLIICSDTSKAITAGGTSIEISRDVNYS